MYNYNLNIFTINLYIIKFILNIKEVNMKLKIFALFIFLIFLLNFVSISGIHNINSINIAKPNEFKIQGNGWLEEINGVKILHLNGSYYEMGYQHGVLLKEEIQQNLRAFINYSDISYEKLVETWYVMQDYVPQQYIEEYQGIADGADVPFNDVVAGYMTIVWSDMACFGISAWGPATKNGKLYHTRSLDQPMIIKDPVSGKYAHENSVLVIRKPENGYASLCPAVAGGTHFGGGINEKGIALGMQVCWSKDQTINGTPAKIRTQMVLDHASSSEEAIDFLTTNKTLGWNFVLSDANVPIGYAVETSANLSYVGTFNDPVESKEPFWAIDHVIRRTNFFIDPDLVSYQRDEYNPSTILSLIKALFGIEFFFAIWKSYQVMSKHIENNLGNMDINTTMDMFRTGYSGRTSLIFYIIIRLAAGTSFTRSWNLWVADPISGDMAVCFASRDNVAYKNPVHHFNLFSLLNSEPP